MNNKDNKDTLRVVGGIEAKTKSKPTRNLTSKQLCFIDQVVDGKSQTEAYRHCYDCSTMKAPTVHSRSYDLRNDSEIAVRIERGLAKKARDNRLTHSKRYDIVLERLLEETDPVQREDSTQAGRVSALKALGQISMDGQASMFVERSEVTQSERSSDDVLTELRLKLASLND